jgi:MoaA/NifB/PqqE/SkfB family radical SAM enzyme
MNGTAKACCDSQKAFTDIDLKKTTIEEAFNSEEYKKLRLDMVNGIKNEYCNACYNLENQNIISSRQKWNEHHAARLDGINAKYTNNDKFDGTVDTEFVSLDLRPSNICNFKCRTCNDSYSTKWQEEKEDFIQNNMGVLAFGNEKIESLNKVDFVLNEDSMKNMEVLYFAGGEPFVLEEHFKLLESIKNKSNISLMYNTNFSILKYKGKTIFEYLKDFRKVHFSISIDGLGEVGEYVRTGFDTKVFKKNLSVLKWAITQYKNISYDFQYTCSLLNAYDFFDFMKELGESEELINFYFVHFPWWYNPVNFPEHKQKIIKLYESKIGAIKSQKLKEGLEKYINYLKSAKITTWDKENARKYLIAHTTHSLIFNDTFLPEKLSFIDDIINEDTRKNPIL